MVKRRATAAGFALVSLLLVSLALLFAVLAMFLWPMTWMDTWTAALIMVGSILAVALVIWLVGRLIAFGASSSRGRSDEMVQAVLDEASVAMKKDGGPLVVAGAALALGFAIGRRLNK